MGIDLLEAKVFPSYTLAYYDWLYIRHPYNSQICLTDKGIDYMYRIRIVAFIRSCIRWFQRDSIRTSSKYFHLPALCTRLPECFNLCRDLAFIYPRAGQVHQDRFFTTNYGTLRKCHFTIDIRLFCWSIWSAHWLLDINSVFPLSDILCNQRP